MSDTYTENASIVSYNNLEFNNYDAGGGAAIEKKERERFPNTII